ncbi:RDD family protein [Chishuiella changwenlii]|jgi:uncharacterized RDD family membrane protein YckC|uniref:RDD family protein n=2 Tax=Chishuiella changwenlii TaxID=1434701 RepID=A0A1M6U436_9FLAO|nr:RDD family protein [Chishuiella changwenlii]SHK63911.1 RDD family protein [Chishuiella changwenlii]
MNTINQNYDTFYRRIIARCIDFIIFAFLNVILSFIVSLFNKPRTMNLVISEDNDPKIEVSNVEDLSFVTDWFMHNNFYITLLFILYMIITNYYFGKSLGKMCTSVRVMNIDEISKLSFSQAIKRSLFGIIYLPILYFYEDNLFVIIAVFIYFILNCFHVLSNKKNLTFEDVFAKTIAIRH